MKNIKYTPFRNTIIDDLSNILYRNKVSIYQDDECRGKSQEESYAGSSKHILDSFVMKIYKDEDARKAWKLEFKKEVCNYFYMVLNESTVDNIVNEFADRFEFYIPDTSDGFINRIKSELARFNNVFHANVDTSFFKYFSTEIIFFAGWLYMPVYIKPNHMEVRIENNTDPHIYVTICNDEEEASVTRIVNHNRRPKVKEEINTI